MRHQIEPGSAEGWNVLYAAVRRASNRLGDGLVSSYAIGSLAHGGFAAAVSDVDLALLTDERTGPQTRDLVATVADDMRAEGHAFGNRLSVFHTPWASFSQPPVYARFPPIDRYDLMRYGILVYGDDLRADYGTRPTTQEIRAQAVDSALRRVTPDQLQADLRELGNRGVSVHDATKAVLWPVRLQHVCDTGQATGNAAAVDHYVALAGARHRPLVRDALAWRDRSSIPEPKTTFRRISSEIHRLHAEVFGRLSRNPSIPRSDEIGLRARQISSG